MVGKAWEAGAAQASQFHKEGKIKRLIGFLSVATLAVVLAAPLGAQTFRVTGSVPVEFMVGGRSMPAGDYTVARVGGTDAIKVSDGNTSALSWASNASLGPMERTGQTLLIFHRYGDQYFLSRIVDGSRDACVELPPSRNEKELSKTASIERFETVAVLARR
jgi:hypothetical protein